MNDHAAQGFRPATATDAAASAEHVPSSRPPVTVRPVRAPSGLVEAPGSFGQRLVVAIDDQGGRLVLDQVLELVPELLRARRRRSPRTSPARADPRSRRGAGGSCSGARSRSASSGRRPAGRGRGRLSASSSCGERDRHEVPALHRDHRRVAARQQVLGGAVAEVARVLHVERDRVGAAQLVADVLGHDRRLDAELP